LVFIVVFINSMPKRRSVNVRRPRKSKMIPGEMSYEGTVEIPISASTTAASVNLHSLLAAGTPFLQTLGDLFQFYRFENLKFTLLPFPDHATADGSIAISYQPEITDAVPTQASQLLAMPQNLFMTDGATVPMSFQVGRRTLVDAPNKMWRTQLPSQTNTGSGVFPSSTLWDSIQGVLWFLGSASISAVGILKYVVKLASPVASALTPGPRIRSEQVMGHSYLLFQRVGGKPARHDPDLSPLKGLPLLSLGNQVMHPQDSSALVAACHCGKTH